MWLVEGKDTEELMNILQCAGLANNVEVEKNLSERSLVI